MRRALQRWYWNHLAAWCILFRQRESALRYYSKMLALDPHDTLAMASIGFRYAEAGRTREAFEMFDRVLALQPNDAEAHFNRGFLLQEMRDHVGALTALRRAIEINPEHDRAHYGIGLSMIALRRFEEAVAPLKRNTRLQPMSPYGWYQLARVQLELGRRDEAQTVHGSLDEVRAEGREATRARDPPQVARMRLDLSGPKRYRVPDGLLLRRCIPEPVAPEEETVMQLTEKHLEYWQKNLRITAILLSIWFVVTFVMGYYARELSVQLLRLAVRVLHGRAGLADHLRASSSGTTRAT